jgi:colicin import membrane protein
VYQAYRVTAMLSNEWKIPLNVAIGIHVLVFLSAIYLPGMFKATPRFADIYTVSIVNIAEPAAVQSPPAKAQKATPPRAIVPKKIPQKIAPIAEKTENIAPVPVTPTVQKSISLKPLKKKKIQEVKAPENLERNKELERKKRQKLAEALREEEILSEQAKLAQEALEAERRLLNPQTHVNTSQTTSSTSSENRTSNAATTAGGSSNLLESQYLASVFNRLHQYWAPPDFLQQDPNLTTVVVITINLDGSIANTHFESKSGDRVFDQFVSTTLEAAAPMPPIPPALKKQRFEVGLRFRPGSIQ